jgi:hypothetical protein
VNDTTIYFFQLRQGAFEFEKVGRNDNSRAHQQNDRQCTKHPVDSVSVVTLNQQKRNKQEHNRIPNSPIPNKELANGIFYMLLAKIDCELVSH